MKREFGHMFFREATKKDFFLMAVPLRGVGVKGRALRKKY